MEQTLKLWLLSQTENSDYDTYDSCVVAAFDEESAKAISPDGDWGRKYARTWASSPIRVSATLIGTAAQDVEPGSVICSSFNAG